MEVSSRRIPTPILKTTVPQMFSVSAVASADACLLKAIFKASSHEGALLQGPRAVLGNLAHELAERAIRGIGRTGEATTFEELEQILGSLLDDSRERLNRNPATASYADLPYTMIPLAWARKRRMILDLAYESAGRARPFGVAHDSLKQGNFRFENLPRDGRWVEVPIEVPELRIKGRMDVLDRHGNETKITDIKSGSIEDENGKIVESVLRQIQLYGLMANWLEPLTCVFLTILADVERPVPFDAYVRDETLAWLRAKMDLLPPGTAISCDSLAQIGPDCRWCDMRHRCVRYLREAPSLWAKNQNWSLPLDIWGTVQRIDANGNGLVDLTLRDDGGRQVKVFRLRNVHAANVNAGDKIWLFDLSASATDIRGSIWRHPLNFHEMGDSASDRAWSLNVFSGTPTT
jgi:hypothetical protein